MQPSVAIYLGFCFLKITNVAHHAQVLPVLALANDVPHAVEGGARVLVDGNLLVRACRFVLACGTRKQNGRFNVTLAVTIQQTKLNNLRLQKV